MTYESLLTATCTLEEETYETNSIGESIRKFGDPVSVKCRLNPNRVVREDVNLGKIIQDTTFVLFLAADADVSEAHKVTHNGTDYKIDNVREFHDGIGNLHHYECDLQEIG